MLCSECSREVLPIAVFDVDGTLADYHKQLTVFSDNYWGYSGEPRRIYPWDGEGEFEDYLGLDKDRYREMKLAFRQGGQKRMMPIIQEGRALYRHVLGVDERATSESAASGAIYHGGKPRPIEIWIVTHRPWRRLDNVDPDTRFWLERYGIKFDHLLFGEDKYGELVQQVDPYRIIAVFEDLPEMCERAEELELPVRQVARTHNSAASQKRPHRGTLDQLTYWFDEQWRQWEKETANE